MHFTFDPSQQSIYETEVAFFESIRTSAIHLVHNRYDESVGYLGESAAAETSYALYLGKPVILLHPLVLGPKVPALISHFLEDNLDLVSMCRLDLLDARELPGILAATIANHASPTPAVADRSELRDYWDQHLEGFKRMDSGDSDPA